MAFCCSIKWLIDKLFEFRFPVGADNTFASGLTEKAALSGATEGLFTGLDSFLRLCPINGMIGTGSVKDFFFQAQI